MINNFYSSVNNGNLVDKCSHKLHYVPEQPYLLRNNFLSEFRTALEKAKVRANLGIADSETLFWGNIQGDIAEQADISKYVNSLLAFDYTIQNNFDAGDNFLNVKNVRDAAITCLDYLSKFKGEGAEIQALDIKIKEILKNLYAVDSLDDVEASLGGVINELTTGVKNLLDKLGNPNTTVEDIEAKLDEVEGSVNQVNTILEDINSLLVKYVPTDGTNNALEIVPDTEVTETKPKVDEEGNPVYDALGFPVFEEVTVVKKGGLYVKDLQPLVDELNTEINGDSGKISLLLKDIQKNSEGVQSNKTAIEGIQGTSIPAINEEIEDIKRNYVSKESLGSSSPIVTDDKLQLKLNGYVKTDSTASLNGITSKNDTISIDKPFNFTTNDPGDSRRYVAKKEDLLKITNYWPGMEVIVIEDALMYILKKDGDPSDPTYNGWKIADSLKIEVLSREEFEARKKAGDLNPLVYYYIYTEDITFKEYPLRSDYETLAEFDYAVQLWREAAYILQGQYMSAAWGQDLDNRMKYKVDKAIFDNAVSRISVIEAFFNSKEGDTLSSLKESIQAIYKPAYVEVNNKGETINKPESGILVTLSDKVNAIDKRVGDLENAGFVKWSDIGAGNEIVTDPELTNRLGNYVEKDSNASIEGLTSKKDSITIDKSFSVKTNQPLDPRRYVETYQDLFTIDPTTAYDGMEVIVKSDGFIMMLLDIANITREVGWKNVGLASIVEITLEEYKLRSDNTNEDGTSKGHLYLGTTEEIPTLIQNVYYFIKETPITFKELPKRNGRTDEEWIADLETWKQDTYLLWHMFLTASWGEDMTAKVNNKVDKAVFDVNLNLTEENRALITNILNQLEILNGYFENTSEVKIEQILDAATKLRSEFDALSASFNDIKTDLYGNATTKPKFVTWAALGGEGEDALDEGKTLFVKTDIYEANRLSDSKEFTTEKLTFPGTATIHHEAIEEVSHTDEITGEKVVDVEAQEAYDEEVPDPLSITRKENRIKVGNEEVAFKEDLLKSVEFDSYPIYFEWILGRGTIDGKPESETYDEWIVGKNLEDWYFLIKYDGTVLPPKNEGESQEAYETRLEPFKKGMLVTAYDAELLYATKGALQAAVDTLTAKVNYENMRVNKVKEQLAEDLQGQNVHINQIETNLNQTCTELREENIQLNLNTLNTFYTAWGRFYNSETGITDLGTVIDTSEKVLTTNITAVLKEFTTSEVERVAAGKLEANTFKEIWDTYYTADEDGVVSYTPLKDILSAIVGTEEDEESLSLASLKAQIDLRETIENHNTDVATLRSELADAVTEVKEYSDTNKDSAIDKCLSAILVTYKELKDLRDSELLVKGRSYRIIDYITTTKDTTTKVIWHPFDIIVTATNNNELSELAYATKHEFTEDEEEDIYYKNCNLTAWELRYILDNDATRYSWIDDRYIVVEGWQTYSVGDIIPKESWETLSEANLKKCEQIGKGIIYYMKDEFNNECAYDFKSILFERYYIPQLVNPKALAEWIINQNYSAISATILNTGVIFPFYKSSNEGKDPSKFYYTYDLGEQLELTVYNANNGLNTCRDNHFAYPCNFYNVMYDGVDLVLDKNRMILNNNVFIGTEFVSNTCNLQGFAFNTILEGASFNTFGANFAFNIIGTTFTNNIFLNDCRRNVINARFKYNTTGNKFSDNCISTDSENNTFKELFVNNALSAHTTENIFGNNIKASEFPEYFKNNELGGDTTLLKVSDTAKYMLFCYFNKGIYQLDIVDSKQRSNLNSWYQYIHFNWCAYSNTKQIDLSNGDFLGTKNNFEISPGNKYIVEIQNSTTPNLGYVWCPADVIAFVNSLYNKVTALEGSLEALTKRVSNTEENLAKLESKFTEEQKYTDSIVTALTQFAKNNGVIITLLRPNNNL